MWWKLTYSEFNRRKGKQNRSALEQIIRSGETPGILAYTYGEPVGWVAVEPKTSFPRLLRSRVLKTIDNMPVWSIVCFFAAKPYRHLELSQRLIEAAVAHVRGQGGQVVEAYPVEPKSGRTPDVFTYTGRASSFRKAGFAEVARISETRPIMRFYIPKEQASGPKPSASTKLLSGTRKASIFSFLPSKGET